MKQIVFILTFFSFCTFASVPRQRITILNHELHKNIKKVKVDYFAKIPSEVFYFNDPYQKHKKVKVQGIALEELFKYFAPSAKSVKMKAINLYNVHIQRNVERSKTTYLMYKQDGKWLKNSELGPMRVIRSGLGVIAKDALTEEGADWIWMINEIQFIYK